MNEVRGTRPAMRAPECWLAALRIAIGAWFAKALFTKLSVVLLWGFLPVPTASERWVHILPILLTKYAEGFGNTSQRAAYILRSGERQGGRERVFSG